MTAGFLTSAAPSNSDVLTGCGRRGGAEKLAYLANHPDPDVRDTLESVLRVYRGGEARRLRERLRSSDSSASDLDNR